MRPSLGQLFGAWAKIGAFSFGGGQVVLETIRRDLVERRGWVTPEAFARDWALVQAAPGINLFGMTTLIGRELGGARGAVVSTLGLALPSALVTLALAMGLGAAQRTPGVESAMRGIVPATAGLGLASVARVATPLLATGWKADRAVRAATVALPVFGLVGLAAGLPPVALLLGGALVGAFVWWRAGR